MYVTFKGLDSEDRLPTGVLLESQSDIEKEVSFCHWRVGRKAVSYCREGDHTLSIYLNGGLNAFRTDVRDKKGAPGKICLMPQGHESYWQVNDTLELGHMYFSDSLLKRYASLYHDIDSRQIQLQDLVYEDDEILGNLLLNYSKLQRRSALQEGLFSEQTLHSIFERLIGSYSGARVKQVCYRGGMSGLARKQLRSYIIENLSHKLTIEALSAVVGLSPFHFAHVFKDSFGGSPAAFVIYCRVERSKSLIKSGKRFTDIASELGFAQSSHFSLYFKKWVGMTPSVYKQML